MATPAASSNTYAAGRPGPSAVLRGQPKWVLPILIGILTVAGVLFTWRLGASGLSTYYASAAKSMATSWRSFALGSLDPSATWTLDKLSGFLVPQALAIRVLGFHAWVLDLPQVLEGLVTVFASYVVGARWRGPVVGLGVAAVVTLTPMLAAMFGRPMEDGMLTMTMVLAFAALQRALLSPGIGWLLISAAWVAVGFQAKMMQAWLIVPALLVAYLVGASGSLRRRIGRVLIAGATAAVLSIAWIGGIQLAVDSAGPYVDGSTNDNVFSMVFGYNGVDRILPDAIPGAVPQLGTQQIAAEGAPVNGTATQDAGHSVAKLLRPEFLTQIGWLYPAAVTGAALEAIAVIRRRRSRVPGDRSDRALVIGAALWLAVTIAVLSAAFVPHATYFAVIALPIAMFAAVGFVHAVQGFRVSSGRGRLILPVLVAVQTAWALVIATTSATSTRPVSIIVLGLGLLAIACILIQRARRVGPTARVRWARATISVAIAAALIGPAIWSSFVLGPGGGGSASDAYAGPREVPPPGTRTAAHESPTRAATDAARQQQLVDFVRRHSSQRVLFATDTLAIAVAINLDDGGEVIPMGGFSRQAPWPSTRWLQDAVHHGRLRYVLLADSTEGAPPNLVLQRTRQWTRSACRPVMNGMFRHASTTRQTLYDCRA